MALAPAERPVEQALQQPGAVPRAYGGVGPLRRREVGGEDACDGDDTHGEVHAVVRESRGGEGGDVSAGAEEGEEKGVEKSLIVSKCRVDCGGRKRE